jgi:hypothetical protein
VEIGEKKFRKIFRIKTANSLNDPPRLWRHPTATRCFRRLLPVADESGEPGAASDLGYAIPV